MKKSGCCPKCGHHDILYVPAKGITGVMLIKILLLIIISLKLNNIFVKHVVM